MSIVQNETGPIRRRAAGVNLPTYERQASVAIGSVLVLVGARLRSLGGAALAAAGAGLVARGVSGHCPVYRRLAISNGVDVRRSIMIKRSPEDVFAACRELRNLPRFLKVIGSVEERDSHVSHWVASVDDLELEWLAELVEEIPGRRLRWRALPGGDIEHEGTIELYEATRGRGTLVAVTLKFGRPKGKLTEGFRHLVVAMTSRQLETDLLRLRELLETGHIEDEPPDREELAAIKAAEAEGMTPPPGEDAMAPKVAPKVADLPPSARRPPE